MLKRIIVIVIGCILMVNMLSVSAFAQGISDKVVYDIDFATGEAVDKTGNMLEFVIPASLCVIDETLNKTVLELWRRDCCQIKGYDVAKLTAWTLEVFVKITADGDIHVLNLTNGNANIVALADCTYFGFGSDSSRGDADVIYNQSLPRNEWLHIVMVNTGSAQTVYLNNEVIAQETYNTTFPEGVTSTIYLGEWYPRKTSIYIDSLRLYSDAATAVEVANMYETVVQGIDDTTATVENPVSKFKLVELPTGGDFKIVADATPAFKSNDNVKIKLSVKEICQAGLDGLDLRLVYNSELLSFNKDNIASCANGQDTNGVDWWMTSSQGSVDQGVGYVDIHMGSNKQAGVTADDILWVELPFVALCDSTTLNSELIAYTMPVYGALNDDTVSLAYGTGISIYTDVSGIISSDTTAPITESQNTTDENASGGFQTPMIIGLSALLLLSVVVVALLFVRKSKVK